MKPFVIADEDTVLGFALAGVQGVVATSEGDIRTAFEAVVKRQDVGIVFITERVAQQIRALIDKWIMQGGQPLFVEIPDSHGPVEGRRTPHEFVKSAIGVSF